MKRHVLLTLLAAVTALAPACAGGNAPPSVDAGEGEGEPAGACPCDKAGSNASVIETTAEVRRHNPNEYITTQTVAISRR